MLSSVQYRRDKTSLNRRPSGKDQNTTFVLEEGLGGGVNIRTSTVVVTVIEQHWTSSRP